MFPPRNGGIASQTATQHNKSPNKTHTCPSFIVQTLKNFISTSGVSLERVMKMSWSERSVFSCAGRETHPVFYKGIQPPTHFLPAVHPLAAHVE